MYYYFCLFFIALFYYQSISKQIKYNKAIIHTILTVLIFLSIFQIENVILRNTIGIPILSILCLDFIATQFYGRNFHSRLDYAFALSIIETDKNEAKCMILHYRKYIILYMVYVALSIIIINFFPPLPTFYDFYPIVILALYLLILYIKSYLHNKRKNNIDSFILRFIEETPISNLVPFLEVLHDRKIIRSLASRQPNYSFKSKQNDIETFVIVIGESARPNNMSLYGYHRSTTPICDFQKENMLIFNNAYSPSSVTATAVPISLSKANVEHLKFDDYSDNIVHVANQLGLKTFWFSNQGQYGNYSNAITGIAMNCHEKKWLDNGSYDKNLLENYMAALECKEKKLIVLHLYGSHVPCEHRYPETESIFNNKHPDDFYDNSIHYTDSLLGEIFDSLAQENASVMYFSDHGLERLTKENKVIYQHGGANASIDAFKIPMFVWYSPSVRKNHPTGEVDDIWLSENNYYFISDWLGVELSPSIEEIKQQNDQIKVISTTGKLRKFSLTS